MTDPLDALRAPIVPVDPDPAFAADLRASLERAVLDRPPSTPEQKEPRMPSTVSLTRPRNGARHGDVSYISLGLPDLARGQAFYGAVLGWRFSPGHDPDGAQVDDVAPMVGLWQGEQPAGGRVHGAVLGYRVGDLDAAVAAVRAHGGTVSDPRREPYGMAAEGRDNQGISFYLHEMASLAQPVPANGELSGDLSYLTMIVPDVAAAREFYGSVLGWSVEEGSHVQVSGVAPQLGMAAEAEDKATTAGVILCYRVDDIDAAVLRVRVAGGEAAAVATRPYGLESLCRDDQDTPFYLHELR